jgi:pSer/pThr/pTyr-binding forkhead associated (FHA) protein
MTPPLLDPFRQACGAAELLTLECLSPDREVPELRTVEHPFVLLGRDRRNDLCLAERGVSLRHAYLQVIRGNLFFVDLGSRTGVSRDGRLRPFGWLVPGQTLRIQSFAVRLLQPVGGKSPAPDPPSRNPLDKRPPDAPLTPAVTVEILGGPSHRVRWRINRVLTLVGAGSACKVRLRDPRVSRYHCSLLHTAAGVWVIDLVSTEGTRINGQSIRWSRLADGDELEIGPYRIRASYDTPGPWSAPLPLAAAPATALAPRAETTRTAPASLVPATAGLALRDQALLVPLLEQFQVMQQQTLDQFHQTMLMMAQLFTTLHREQMDLVRDELERMHRLTREIQELRGQLAGPLPDSRPPEAPRGKDTPTQGPEQKPPEPAIPPSGSPPDVRPGASASPPLPASAGTASDPSIHVWLSRRIAELNAEREGSWQKIKAFLVGK